MPQSVAHATDVAPGLVRHEFVCAYSKPMSGLTHPLYAAFDGITDRFVLFKRLPIHAGEIARDPLGIVDDVAEAVGRIVPRRQCGDLVLR